MCPSRFIIFCTSLGVCTTFLHFFDFVFVLVLLWVRHVIPQQHITYYGQTRGLPLLFFSYFLNQPTKQLTNQLTNYIRSMLVHLHDIRNTIYYILIKLLSPLFLTIYDMRYTIYEIRYTIYEQCLILN